MINRCGNSSATGSELIDTPHVDTEADREWHDGENVPYGPRCGVGRLEAEHVERNPERDRPWDNKSEHDGLKCQCDVTSRRSPRPYFCCGAQADQQPHAGCAEERCSEEPGKVTSDQHGECWMRNAIG